MPHLVRRFLILLALSAAIFLSTAPLSTCASPLANLSKAFQPAGFAAMLVAPSSESHKTGVVFAGENPPRETLANGAFHRGLESAASVSKTDFASCISGKLFLASCITGKLLLAE